MPWADGDFATPTNLNSQGSDIINVASYGALGDPSTDDTTAINDAITAWVAAPDRATLYFPPKRYLTSSALTANFDASNISNKVVNGYGATILSQISAGNAFAVTVDDGVLIRNLAINGLQVECPSGDICFKFDGGTTNSPNNFLYHVRLNDLTAERFGGTGFVGTGNFFESAFNDCYAYGASDNTTGSGFSFFDGGGDVSSIAMHACNTAYGLYGVVADSGANVKVFDGTFLLAYNYGIYLPNNLEGGAWGAHVENNWSGGTTNAYWSASVGVNQAGLYMTGSPMASHVYGTGDSGYQRYVIRAYANPIGTIIGGSCAGDTEYYVRAEGVAGGKLNVIGTTRGSNCTAVVDNRGNNAAGMVNQIGVQHGNASTASNANLVLTGANPLSLSTQANFNDMTVGQVRVVQAASGISLAYSSGDSLYDIGSNTSAAQPTS